MNGWSFFAIYSVGALISARLLYSIGFEIDYKDSLKRGVKSEDKRLEFARKHGLVASLAGLTWPLTWTIILVIFFITSPTRIEQKIAEREKAENHAAAVMAEMSRLKSWHEENQMDPPDTTTLRFMAEENVKNES